MGVLFEIYAIAWITMEVMTNKELESEETDITFTSTFHSSLQFFSTPELRLLRTDELPTFPNSESPLPTALIKNYALVLPLLFSTEQTSTRRKLVRSFGS